jgi:hypothetical protein
VPGETLGSEIRRLPVVKDCLDDVRGEECEVQQAADIARGHAGGGGDVAQALAREQPLRPFMGAGDAADENLVIVNAIWVWNELLFALVFLQNNSQRTLMAGLALFQGRYSTNEPLVMAGAFLSILPLVILYLASQPFFVQGMTAGIGK